MKVKEFVKQYRFANKVHDGGINFIKEHINNVYVSYMDKMARCQLLVNSCWYRTNPETGIRRLVVNSANLHLMFIMELIRQYTDLDLQYEGQKLVEDYDDLRRTGTLTQILALIPVAEVEEYKKILELTKNDLMINEYEPGAYIRNRISDSGKIFGDLIVPMLEKAGITKETFTTLLSSVQDNYVSDNK